MKPPLTPAQQRALAWLPEDGSWRDQPGRLSASLWDLYLRGIAERNWGRHGKDGRKGYRWRLTPHRNPLAFAVLSSLFAALVMLAACAVAPPPRECVWTMAYRNVATGEITCGFQP